MNFVSPVAVTSRETNHQRSARRAVATQLFVLAASFLIAIVVPQPSAAQILVNNPGPTQVDTTGGSCSLQEAIYATEFGTNVALDQTDPDETYNTGCFDPSGKWDTIVLQNVTYQFSNLWDGDAHNPFGPTATPIIFKKITIQGNGATLQATGTGFRLFAVGEAGISPRSGVLTSGTYSRTGALTLQDLYIKDFHVKGGDGAAGGGGGLGAGGAIYVGKTTNILDPTFPALTVETSTFENNGATGGNGAAIGRTLGGGGGGGLGGNGGNGGNGGGGGGGARGNGGHDDSGGGGGGGTVFGGTDSIGQAGGFGGYLCGGGGASFELNTGNDGHDGTCAGGGGGGSSANNNIDTFAAVFGGDGAYGGGGGGADPNVRNGNGGNGGFGGGGGHSSGCIGQCSGNGGFGAGGGGGDGNGGAFGGSGGENAFGDTGGGGGALGGAIFNDTGFIVVRNSTFSKNLALHGSGGGGTAGNGGDSGGAIFSHNGSTTIQNVTISGNKSSVAGGGLEVLNDNGTSVFILQNTIVANNGEVQECIVTGSVATSNGGSNSTHNLILANGGCPAATVNSDPKLGLLQLNGGDTPTMAIQFGVSPAVDAGDDSVVSATPALQTSQNGLSRPQGPHSDIGAYEAPPPSADLNITKSVSPTTAQPGDTITYTLNVSNAGPNTANNVTVTDTLPSQLTFVSCTADSSGTCTFASGAVSVTYPSLAANAFSIVMINATLNSGVTDGLQIGNNASVSASDPTDPNIANNTSANVFFTVHNKADLAVTKSVSSTSPYFPATGIEVGDALTYTVTLTNKGPYDARSVVLSDSAPAGVTFTGCTASTGTCVWSASGASLSLASFTNASVATLTIQATLNFGVADGSTVTNSASVTSPTNDPDPTNNAGSASFTVLNNSDLFVTQSATKLSNRQLNYTVNVKNLGKYIGKQLLLSDAIPPGSKFGSIKPGPWTCSAPPSGSNGTISCNLSTEAVGATQAITFVVKVTTPGNVLVNNTAVVSAATFDPNTANNNSSLLTKVGP